MDSDVSKLLQQLEELRQKKAQSVKKLKKKLGRASVLKQNVSKIDPIEDNVRKVAHTSAKDKPSESRYILGELSSKNNSECNIKNLLEQQTICSGNNGAANISLSLQNSCRDFKAEDSVTIVSDPDTKSCDKDAFVNKNISSEKEICHLESSEFSNAVASKRKGFSNKRSVDELHDDVSAESFKVNKKTRVDITSTESGTELVSELKCESSDLKVPQKDLQNSNKNHVVLKRKSFENDSECICPSQPKVEDVLAKLDYSSAGLQNSEGKSEYKTVAHAAEDNLESIPECSEVRDELVNHLQNEMQYLPGIESDKTFDDSKSEKKILEYQEKDTVRIQPVVKNTSVSNLNKNNEQFYKPDDKNYFEDDIDLNVSEVADTEVCLLAVKQSLISENSNILTKTVMGNLYDESKISETVLEKDKGEIYNEVPPCIDVSPEDVCFMNVESDVASFEEVSTEKEPEVDGHDEDSVLVLPEEPVSLLLEGNRDLSLPKKKEDSALPKEDPDPFDCTFSDEEDDHGNFISSREMRALFKSDDDYKDSQEDQFTDTELEVPETDMLDSKSKHESNVVNVCDEIDEKPSFKDVEDIEDEKLNHLATDSEVLVVPETEIFDFARYNESEVDNVAHNVCVATVKDIDKPPINEKTELNCNVTPVSKKCKSNYFYKKNYPTCSTHNFNTFEDTEQKMDSGQTAEIVCTEMASDTEFDTDTLNTENFLKLACLQQEPLTSRGEDQDLTKVNKVCDNQSSLKFKCCLQSDISEKVSKLKMATFNHSLYLFIQHLTWIQVWRLGQGNGWIKIFAHQVEDLQIEELCLSQNENYLVLVMLLKSEYTTYCLQFLVFERESRLIKLMEHTHWFENKCEGEETVFLCGLNDLKFAAAQGLHTFQVSSYSFSCLDNNPRLHTVTLGSTVDYLHSLCRIDKLPNALLGMNNDMLYVWHLLEARLVTSVRLQVDSPLKIENCIWSVVENGLVFLMAGCKDAEGPNVCQLLAVNLATGFCEIALTYTAQPAQESKLEFENALSLAYAEPIIGITSSSGAFIWSAEEEYCCAFLGGTNYSSIAIQPSLNNSFMISVGCTQGCVNCYELKFTDNEELPNTFTTY